MEKANSKSIFKHLFSEMKRLKNGEISVDEAKSQAHLARQANNVLKYELDRAKTVAEFPGTIREIED